MSDIGRMRSAEAVLFGVVEIVRLDEFEAIVGLGPASEKGELFRFLRNEPERFAAVTLDDFGHSIRSVDNEGDEVDFGSNSLRRHAERQPEPFRLAS